MQRSVDLNPAQRDLVLKVAELLVSKEECDSRAEFWVDKAAKLLPGNPAVFNLKVRPIFNQQLPCPSLCLTLNFVMFTKEGRSRWILIKGGIDATVTLWSICSSLCRNVCWVVRVSKDGTGCSTSSRPSWQRGQLTLMWTWNWFSCSVRTDGWMKPLNTAWLLRREACWAAVWTGTKWCCTHCRSAGTGGSAE